MKKSLLLALCISCLSLTACENLESILGNLNNIVVDPSLSEQASAFIENSEKEKSVEESKASEVSSSTKESKKDEESIVSHVHCPSYIVDENCACVNPYCEICDEYLPEYEGCNTWFEFSSLFDDIKFFGFDGDLLTISFVPKETRDFDFYNKDNFDCHRFYIVSEKIVNNPINFLGGYYYDDAYHGIYNLNEGVTYYLCFPVLQFKNCPILCNYFEEIKAITRFDLAEYGGKSGEYLDINFGGYDCNASSLEYEFNSHFGCEALVLGNSTLRFLDNSYDEATSDCKRAVHYNCTIYDTKTKEEYSYKYTLYLSEECHSYINENERNDYTEEYNGKTLNCWTEMTINNCANCNCFQINHVESKVLEEKDVEIYHRETFSEYDDNCILRYHSDVIKECNENGIEEYCNETYSEYDENGIERYHGDYTRESNEYGIETYCCHADYEYDIEGNLIFRCHDVLQIFDYEKFGNKYYNSKIDEIQGSEVINYHSETYYYDEDEKILYLDTEHYDNETKETTTNRQIVERL